MLTLAGVSPKIDAPIQLKSTKEQAMLSVADKSNLSSSRKGASALVKDLREFSRTENPLLSEIVRELLQQASFIEQRLDRVAVLVGEEKRPPVAPQ